jgi:hypothetical protein
MDSDLDPLYVASSVFGFRDGRPGRFFGVAAGGEVGAGMASTISGDLLSPLVSAPEEAPLDAVLAFLWGRLEGFFDGSSFGTASMPSLATSASGEGSSSLIGRCRGEYKYYIRWMRVA